jgi:hypothetical protein
MGEQQAKSRLGRGEEEMTDWWPALLAHIPGEDPWADDNVVVAEVKSFDEQPYTGHRTTFAALVPIDQIGAVKAALVNFDCEVSTSGPRPDYSEDRPFTPRFWVATNKPSDKYEPLILAWRSHNKTVLQPDPGFLMTYGLVPRAIDGGAVHWDDSELPRHDIVVVSAPSVWDFPLGTRAYVSISKDYLQDYLTLRHMALVQVYWELRWGQTDPEIEEQLSDKEGVEINFPDRRVQLGRAMGDHGSVFAQVWGAHLLALPGELPITADPLDDEGLVWPGIEKPVTNGVARSFGATDHVYVDDSVLAAYEGRQGFRIHPESGSITHGTQWSVSFCERVARNTIRLEIKKLYEGAPASVVRHWHGFAVTPLPPAAFPAAFDEPNIGTRARSMTYALVELGEALSDLAQSLGLAISPDEFVGLRRDALDYSGWWTFEAAEPLSRHAPLDLTADAFLDRCMSLAKLLIERLSEKNLWKILQAVGVRGSEIKQFRGLKLLDRVVCLAQVAEASGLKLAEDGRSLWDRLTNDGTTPPQPIAHLFALYELRILKGHTSSERDKKVLEELKRFDIRAGEESAGYGKILDRVYDALSAELAEVSAKIKSAS